MNYIELILAFEQWNETNYLPSSAQLLWYKIISVFNRAGWCEWISVDNHRLMAMMQIGRESTFINLRDKLIESHFFEFKKGKKGQPNRYKICTVNFESINRSINSSINRNINSSTKRSIYRSRNRRHKYITLQKII